MFFGSAPAPADAGAERPSVRSEFMRGGRGVTMKGWLPALRETRDDVANSWEVAVARATDLVQNNGWISGMFDQAVANTVGTGLRLRCMPENEILGMTEDEAQTWRKIVEGRWELHAKNPVECDIEGRRTIPQMQDAAFRSWLVTGEILGEIVYRRRFGSKRGTKVRLMLPHRLSNRSDPYNRIVSGVQMDPDDFPIAYLAKRRDPILGELEVTVPARDRFGRPKVIHVFVGMPGQVRGITPIVPALKVARQFDQLADTTLMSELMRSIFSAVITSDTPTEDMIGGLLSAAEQARLAGKGISPFEAWFDAQAGWYDANTIDVGIGGRMAHIFPGQKLEFLRPDSPDSAYKDFSMHLLREQARCLGLTYESATGDYSGATYSSVRMAVNEIFPITLARREFVVAPFCQPIYEAWLEEEIELGFIPFPGGIGNFLANRVAACRAEWRGAPKPQADDLKTATSQNLYREMGVISDEVIANELGLDIEDVYAQRARERELRKKYGLPETDKASMAEADRRAQEVIKKENAKDKEKLNGDRAE
jgi:lambda family phage portal protein